MVPLVHGVKYVIGLGLQDMTSLLFYQVRQLGDEVMLLSGGCHFVMMKIRRLNGPGKTAKQSSKPNQT